jgi:hypothetical protein
MKDLLAFAPSADLSPLAEDQSSLAVNESSSVIRCGHPHFCSHYRNAEEQWQMLKPHLLKHLEPGSATVYLYDGDVDQITGWLAEEGYNALALQAQGILRLIPADSIYLEGGVFQVERMLNFWKNIILNCKAIRTKRLLITGEMTWAINGAPGSELLLDYELALDEMASNYPWLTLLCQYDLNHFSAATVFDTLTVHPCVQLKKGMAAGFASRA